MQSIAGGTGGTAIGAVSRANGQESTAIGEGSQANGDYSTALGQLSLASGAQSTALGQLSKATGDYSTAVGQSSNAAGTGSIAVGDSSLAGFSNSTAIGFEARTTRANQMMFGTASNTYTAPGITSAASTAAQTGPTQVVTSDANGNLATSDLSKLPAFQGLQQQVNRNSEGIAMAIALGAGGAILPEGKDHAVAVDWGNFEGGNNAMGISGVERLGENLFLNAALGLGCGQGTVGGRAGLTYAW